MVVKTCLLHSFDTDTPENSFKSVDVPQGSMFLDIKILHDGVHCWFAVPELELTEMETHKFWLLKPDEKIPEDCTFVKVLDTIISVDGREGMMIIPVFKANS